MTALLLFIATWSIRATVVIVTGALAAVVRRKRSAAQRNLIWRVALLASALVPMIGLVAPRVTAPIEAPTIVIAEAVQNRFATPTIVAPTDSVAASPVGAPAKQSVDWARILVAVYLVSLGVLAVRWTLALFQIILIARRSTPYRADSRIRVAKDKELSVPITFGRTILLPSVSGEWPEDRTEAAIAHERAHIERRDWLTQTAATLLAAIHWFNPAFILLRRLLTATAEEAADDAVLAAGIAPSTYAGALLDVASNVGRPSRAGVAMVHAPKIAARLRRIVTADCDRRPPGVTSKVTTGLVLASLAVVAAGWRFASNDSATISSVTLPGGERVDLLGVREVISGAGDSGASSFSYKTQRFSFWTPDGEPTPEQKQFRLLYSEYSPRYYAKQGRLVSFAFRLLDKKLRQATWRVSVPTSNKTLNRNSFGGWDAQIGLDPAELGFHLPVGLGYMGTWVIPKETRLTDVDLWVAYKPFETILGSPRFEVGPEEDTTDTGISSQLRRMSPVTVEIPDGYEGQDLRIAVTMKNGKPGSLYSWETNSTRDSNGRWKRKFLVECLPDQVKKVVVIARPFEGVTFKNVHLYPKGSSAVRAR